MQLLRAAVPLALCVALAGCADSGEAGVRDARPTSTGRAPAPSADAAADALPPAVQGLEECPGDEDQPFSFRRGADHVHGFARGSSRRVAVLTHQFRGTPCDLSGLAAVLAEQGWRTVSWTTDTSPTPRTLRMLVRRERAHGARWVVLVGASAGAATSLVGAGSVQPAVDAVVALSPADYAMRKGDVERAATAYDGPLMLVAGELEPGFGDLVQELAGRHDGPEQLVVVPRSADHGKDFVRRRDDPMVDEVVSFMAASTPRP